MDRKILGTRPPYKRGSERVNENKKDVRLSRRRKLRIKLGSRQLMSLRRERYEDRWREKKRDTYLSIQYVAQFCADCRHFILAETRRKLIRFSKNDRDLYYQFRFLQVKPFRDHVKRFKRGQRRRVRICMRQL